MLVRARRVGRSRFIRVLRCIISRLRTRTGRQRNILRRSNSSDYSKQRQRSSNDSATFHLCPAVQHSVTSSHTAHAIHFPRPHSLVLYQRTKPSAASTTTTSYFSCMGINTSSSSLFHSSPSQNLAFIGSRDATSRNPRIRMKRVQFRRSETDPESSYQPLPCACIDLSRNICRNLSRQPGLVV